MSPATPVVADTHVVWWYLRRPEKLSTLAREHLAAATEAGLPILVSSVIELEFIWLAKNGRITQHVREAITAELNAGPPFQRGADHAGGAARGRDCAYGVVR